MSQAASAEWLYAKAKNDGETAFTDGMRKRMKRASALLFHSHHVVGPISELLV